MTWQPMNTAPKDGSTIIGHALRVIWKADPPRTDGPFIVAIRWNGTEWVLAERFEFDAALEVNLWMPIGEKT